MLIRQITPINCNDANTWTGSISIASHSTSAASSRGARPTGSVRRLAISHGGYTRRDYNESGCHWTRGRHSASPRPQEFAEHVERIEK